MKNFLTPVSDAFRLSQNPVQFFKDKQNKYGDVFSLNLPGLPETLLTCSAAGAAEIFKNPPSPYVPPSNNPISPLLGANSLILIEGEAHQTERKKLMPLLTGEALKKYVGPIAQIAENRALFLTLPEQNDKPHDLLQTSQNMTLEIIIRIIMGINDEFEIVLFRQKILQLLNSYKTPLMVMPFLRLPFLGFSPWDVFVKNRDGFNQDLLHIINSSSAEKKATPFLSALISLNHVPSGDGAIDDSEKVLGENGLQKICDQIVTFLIAGHETTAITLFWVVFHISKDRNLLEELQSEALAAQAVDGAVDRLPLLEACCKEALRLHPVVPILLRSLKREEVFFNRKLKQGDNIGLVLTLLHRSKDWGENRNQFFPKRFLEPKENIPANSFFPFGAGARRCIGSQFALLEIKVILAKWLQMGLLPKLTTTSSQQPKEIIKGITMGPAKNIFFNLTTTTGV